MSALPLKVRTEAILMIFFLSTPSGFEKDSQCLARERARIKDAVRLTSMTYAFRATLASHRSWSQASIFEAYLIPLVLCEVYSRGSMLHSAAIDKNIHTSFISLTYC